MPLFEARLKYPLRSYRMSSVCHEITLLFVQYKMSLFFLLSLSAEEFNEKAEVIQQRIARLKQDREAVCIPQEIRTGEGKLSPDTGTLAGVRRLSFLSSKNPKEEKTALMYELVNVRVSYHNKKV